MIHTQDHSAAEKGEILPLYPDGKDAVETPHPLYTDEWLNGEPWRYRAILAINLLLIIGGQYAFLCGLWPHFCVVSIALGVEGLINVLTPYLERGPRWPKEYCYHLVSALLHSHFMTSVLSVLYKPDLSVGSIVRVFLCRDRIERFVYLDCMPIGIGVFFGYSVLIRAIGHIASGEPVIPREGQRWKDNIVVESVRYLIRDGGLVLFFFVYSDRVPSSI